MEFNGGGDRERKSVARTRQVTEPPTQHGKVFATRGSVCVC